MRTIIFEWNPAIGCILGWCVCVSDVKEKQYDTALALLQQNVQYVARHFDGKRRDTSKKNCGQTRQATCSRVTEDTDRKLAVSDTTVNPGIYGAVLDYRGFRSFIRRTAMYARVS